jgi:hypothetical protein
MASAHYERILFDVLKFPRDFLLRNQEIIRIRLLSALAVTRTDGTETKVFSPHEDIFVINQCMHLASSVLLLGSREEDIATAINYVNRFQEFQGRDPTTVLSIIMLYYLISEARERVPEDQQGFILRAHTMFQDINWVIGRPGIGVLEFRDSLE